MANPDPGGRSSHRRSPRPHHTLAGNSAGDALLIQLDTASRQQWRRTFGGALEDSTRPATPSSPACARQLPSVDAHREHPLRVPQLPCENHAIQSAGMRRPHRRVIRLEANRRRRQPPWHPSRSGRSDQPLRRRSRPGSGPHRHPDERNAPHIPRRHPPICSIRKAPNQRPATKGYKPKQAAR